MSTAGTSLQNYQKISSTTNFPSLDATREIPDTRDVKKAVRDRNTAAQRAAHEAILNLAQQQPFSGNTTSRSTTTSQSLLETPKKSDSTTHSTTTSMASTPAPVRALNQREDLLEQGRKVPSMSTTLNSTKYTIYKR